MKFGRIKHMKIVICASVDFTPKIKEIADVLLKQGHKVEIPLLSQKILNGEISLEDFLRIKKEKGDIDFRRNSGEDLIKRYFHLIKKSDAVLIVNVDKNEIKNYIGGNTLLEIGFAYILDKKIFLLNEIPDISYKDEIKAMQPVILNGDLSKVS